MESFEEKPQEEEFYAIYPVGLAPGFIISSETVRKVKELETERDDKPSKPPRGRRQKIRVGRVALSEGL